MNDDLNPSTAKQEDKASKRIRKSKKETKATPKSTDTGSKRLRTRGLVVAATQEEIQPSLDAAKYVKKMPDGFFTAGFEEKQWDILITGIGSVNAAFKLAQQLQFKRKYKTVLNVGIAGAWDKSLLIGDVVEVEQECFGDMGANSPGGMLTLETLGFPVFSGPMKDEFAKHYKNQPPVFNILTNPFAGDEYIMPAGRKNRNPRHIKPDQTVDESKPNLTKVRGITLNTVSGDETGIQKLYDFWARNGYSLQVESMEGAAFFLVCLNDPTITFHQFRAISNFVEPREPERWNIPLAIKNLNDFLIQYYL